MCGICCCRRRTGHTRVGAGFRNEANERTTAPAGQEDHGKDLLKETVEYGRQKSGWRISLVSL